MARLKRNLVCIGTFIILLCIGVFFTHQTEEIKRKEQTALIQEFAVAQARAIERRLTNSLSATYFLALEVDHLGPSNFAHYAHNIIESLGGISNLQLAPNGIVSSIYPLEGNEKALGHNILRDDRRRSEALAAINQKQLTLAGPFALVQGGVAVIGRNPVFVEENGQDVFWGFVSAVIYLDDLINVTDLLNLETKGFSYQISHYDPDIGRDDVFFKSNEPLGNLLASTDIDVPNGVWHLSMSQKESSNLVVYFIGYGLTLLVALFVVLSLRYILLQPEKLKEIIRNKTRKLEQLAFYDPLTQLANRRLFIERLSTCCIHSVDKNQMSSNTSALMYIDLDLFKRVNDSLGHDAGDVLLCTVAQRLNTLVGENGLVARLGGDEFAVLLSDDLGSKSEVEHFAEEILMSINEPMDLAGKACVISASIGITLIPDDGNELESVLCHADIAMYKAKESGRNKVCFFHEDLKQTSLERFHIDEELAVALEERQLKLSYQPLVNLKDDSIVSYEALVRWHHPDKGIIHPDLFISIAEESRKIIDIGYWSIEQACLMVKSQLDRTGTAYPVAVNLTSNHFSEPNLVETLAYMLESAGISGHYLELEITESVIMENIETAVTTLEHLREMDIVISIDDFGTGYSSLSMLQKLPVDKVKIDRQFISHLESCRTQQRVVRGIIYLLHTMGLKAVMEGVEREGQADLLKRYGCDIVQGYLYAKPMDSDMLAFYLSSRDSTHKSS